MKPLARGIGAALNFLSAYRVSFETFELTHNNRLDRLGGPHGIAARSLPP